MKLCMALWMFVILQQQERWVGAWKLNPEKTTARAFKTRTVKIEAIAGGIKYIEDSTDAQDRPRHVELTLTYDGKDFVVNENARVAFKRVDSHTFERHGKNKAGDVGNIFRLTVSTDGKTMTETRRNPDGTAITQGNQSTIVVYDKQH